MLLDHKDTIGIKPSSQLKPIHIEQFWLNCFQITCMINAGTAVNQQELFYSFSETICSIIRFNSRLCCPYC